MAPKRLNKRVAKPNRGGDVSHIEWLIRRSEDDAKKILRHHGIRKWATAGQESKNLTKLFAAMDRLDPEGFETSQLWDAREVFEYARRLRREIAAGNAEAAGAAGIILGMTYSRLVSRPFERTVKPGQASLRNLDKGREDGVDRYGAAQERRRIVLYHAQSMTGNISVIAKRIERLLEDERQEQLKTDPEKKLKALKAPRIRQILREAKDS